MILKDRNTKNHSAWTIENREGSHARGVYLTQDISRMGTARMKQEQETDTRIIVIEYRHVPV